MTTFTIDNENNITAFGHAEDAAATTTTPFDTFASQKELAELAARLAGRAPGSDLEQPGGSGGCRELQERRRPPLASIWARIQSLGEAAKPKAEPAKPKADKKAKGGAQAAKGAPAKAKATKKATPAKNAPKAQKAAKAAGSRRSARGQQRPPQVVAAAPAPRTAPPSQTSWRLRPGKRTACAASSVARSRKKMGLDR
jgi:hypothetical protein